MGPAACKGCANIHRNLRRADCAVTISGSDSGGAGGAPSTASDRLGTDKVSRGSDAEKAVTHNSPVRTHFMRIWRVKIQAAWIKQGRQACSGSQAPRLQVPPHRAGYHSQRLPLCHKRGVVRSPAACDQDPRERAQNDMGRPQKDGLNFAAWDVTVLLGDAKINRLMEAQGCPGFVVYFFLCQMAYMVYGYYLRWSYEDAATTAKQIGGGLTAGQVRKIVNCCLRLELFDSKLFRTRGILTSRRMQTTWETATKRRVNCVIPEEIRLPAGTEEPDFLEALNGFQKKFEGGGAAEHTQNRSFCDRNPGFCNGNGGNCGGNAHSSNSKDIVNTLSSSGPDLETVRKAAKDMGLKRVDPDHFFHFYNSAGWRDKYGKPVRNWVQKLLAWERSERAASPAAAGTIPAPPEESWNDEQKLEAMQRFYAHMQKAPGGKGKKAGPEGGTQ